MAARMPMTTMTTNNSTIVKPCFILLLDIRLARLNFSDGGSSTMVKAGETTLILRSLW